MAHQNKVSIESDIDLENEIPLTAIVDVKHAKTELNYPERCNEKQIPKKVKKKPEMSINMKYVCRVCLMPEKNMFSLMTKIGHDVLADMFSAISSINIHLDEYLPMQICVACHNNVVDFYKFRLKCIKTNNILRSLISTKKCGKFTSNETDGQLPTTDKTTQTTLNDVLQEKALHKNDTSNDIKIELEMSSGINEDHEEIEYLDDEIFHIDDSNTEDFSSSRDSPVKLTDPHEMLKDIPNKAKTVKLGFSCKHCTMRFVKPQSLKIHIIQCHSANKDRIFACNKCKEIFGYREDLDIHSALHVKGNHWTCNKCSKVFTERNKFRRHIRRHMKSARHECACGKTFPELHALRRHARIHTGERAEKKYSCDVCQKRFCDNSQLSTHMSQHTGVRPCTCDDCGKAFPSRRLLASHRLVHDDNKRFACDFCDKRFRHESTRNTHHRTHTGEKPFVCSVCGKTFIQNSNLRLHMRTHTGERPYTCDMCGRKFTSGSSLKCHRRIHTGEKPYSCHICGKRFARTDLRTHLRVHTGERPFACCVCSKKFVNAARLREHLLIHTGEKPFECTICKEQFKRKSYLAKHMKGHSKDNKLKKKDTVIVRTRSFGANKNLLVMKNSKNNMATKAPIVYKNSEDSIVSEVPLQVSGELVLQNDNDVNYQDVQISIHTDDIANVSNENTKHFIPVEENKKPLESSIEFPSGNVVKLFQLDQSLVQIQTSSRHITIHKVTSEMTPNFN